MGLWSMCPLQRTWIRTGVGKVSAPEPRMQTVVNLDLTRDTPDGWLLTQVISCVLLLQRQPCALHPLISINSQDVAVEIKALRFRAKLVMYGVLSAICFSCSANWR